VAAVTYQARRSLIAGHSINTSYSLNIVCENLAPVRNQTRIVKRPIGGTNAEIIRWAGFNAYQVSVAPLAGGTPLGAVIEFLDSCEDQSFTFDAYGTVAVPGTNPAPFTAILGAQSYALERVVQLGQGGANDLFRVSFLVEPA
jgi:hypothetical protein